MLHFALTFLFTLETPLETIRSFHIVWVRCASELAQPTPGVLMLHAVVGTTEPTPRSGLASRLCPAEQGTSVGLLSSKAPSPLQPPGEVLPT